MWCGSYVIVSYSFCYGFAIPFLVYLLLEILNEIAIDRVQISQGCANIGSFIRIQNALAIACLISGMMYYKYLRKFIGRILVTGEIERFLTKLAMSAALVHAILPWITLMLILTNKNSCINQAQGHLAYWLDWISFGIGATVSVGLAIVLIYLGFEILRDAKYAEKGTGFFAYIRDCRLLKAAYDKCYMSHSKFELHQNYLFLLQMFNSRERMGNTPLDFYQIQNRFSTVLRESDIVVFKEHRIQPCKICEEAYRSNERVIYVPTCNHLFHSDCFIKWFKPELNCPRCYSRIFTPLIELICQDWQMKPVHQFAPLVDRISPT
jgi:Ring finger domain